MLLIFKLYKKCVCLGTHQTAELGPQKAMCGKHDR